MCRTIRAPPFVTFRSPGRRSCLRRTPSRRTPPPARIPETVVMFDYSAWSWLIDAGCCRRRTARRRRGPPGFLWRLSFQLLSNVKAVRMCRGACMERNIMHNSRLYSGSLQLPSRISATANAMKWADVLAFGLLFFSGCWKGGPLPENQIAYKHDAVLWAYKTGGQIGRYGIVLVPVDNELLDLQPGDGCVHVREGQTGGQCSATPQASLQLTHALDLRTGHPVFAPGPTKRIEHPKPICRGDRGYWETKVDNNLSVYVAGETWRLYLRTLSDVLILRATHPDPHVTFQPWLGVPIAAFRMPDDLLVLGLSQGYVICVDLKKLPAVSAAQTQGAQTVPSK